MKTFRKILWGVVFIALGVLFGLKAFGVLDIDIFFKGWWTLLIIIPSFIGLFDSVNGWSEKAGNIVIIILGVLLLLSCQEVIDFSDIWKFLLPAILVIVGISMLLGTTVSKTFEAKVKKINKEKGETNIYTALFSGQKEKYPKGDFSGCTVSAIFGGMELDLSNVTIKDEAVVNASAVFGGLTIRVPKGVKVKYGSQSFCGGISNEANSPDVEKAKLSTKSFNKDKAPTLYINAKCAFGGVEITDQPPKKK